MHKLLSVLSLSAFGAVFASPSCPNGESYYEGRGEGASMEAAYEKASLAISKSIFSSVRSVTYDSLHQTETTYDYEEFNRRIRSAKMETVFHNAQDIKDKDGYPREEDGGRFVSERYICRSDAAKPWLVSFGVGVAKYSNLAIKIADEKESQKRNDLREAMPGIKESIKLVDVVLSKIASGGISAQMSQEYSKLKDDFKDAEKKIELSAKNVYDKNYGVGLMPLAPGLAQLYKGHYGRAALILGSAAALLAAGGISLVNCKEADGKYKDAVLKYNSSKNVNEKNELLQKSKEYSSDRESAEKTVYATAVLAGVVYAYNIVDGYATTPNLPRWHSTAMLLPSRGGIGAAFALTGTF